jgi:hypothetical protein
MHLLTAMLAEVNADAPSALQNYEASMDHSESNNFVLDEAFSHELYAEWLVRKKAYRAARHSLKDCISTYRRMSAYGKANHVASKYEPLLRGGAYKRLLSTPTIPLSDLSRIMTIWGRKPRSIEQTIG